MSENIWFCKIGGDVGDGLPMGADGPMRDAIEEAFEKLTGKRPQFTFSGWGQELTEGERAVVENRMPKMCEIDRPHFYECKHCGIGPTIAGQPGLETSPAPGCIGCEFARQELASMKVARQCGTCGAIHRPLDPSLNRGGDQ